MIPKIIHQIWLGNKRKRPCIHMDKWRKMNPTWEYRLWSENNIFPLINQHHFDNVVTFTGKADILRYEILMKYGGCYIDADTNPLLPLDDELINNDLFACYDNDRVEPPKETGRKPGQIATSVIGSRPGHPFILIFVEELRNKQFIPTLHNDWITIGPVFFTAMVKKHNTDIKIYPSHYFLPYHPDGNYQGDGKVYCEHFFGTINGYQEQSTCKFL